MFISNVKIVDKIYLNKVKNMNYCYSSLTYDY